MKHNDLELISVSNLMFQKLNTLSIKLFSVKQTTTIRTNIKNFKV